MAKLKSQKEKDLAELTDKLKTAKAAVFTGYRGATVKEMDKFRGTLRKEQVFSKVYKIPLIKKALEALGVDASSVDYKQPVILSLSQEDETIPARIIRNLTKEIKTFVILEGILDGKIATKAQVETLGSLPSKDQLRAQFMSVLNGPISAFARVLNARAEKMGSASVEAAPSSAEATEGKPAAEAPAPVIEAPAAPMEAAAA